MQPNHPKTQPPEASPLSSVFIEKALTSCEQSLVNCIEKLLACTVSQLDDALLHLTGHAGDSDFQDNDYDLLRDVRSDWSNIQQLYSRKTLKHWHDFWLIHRQQEKQAEKVLSISSDASEYTFLNKLDAEHKTQFNHELIYLTPRFEHLSMIGQIKQLPILPFSLGYLFNDSLIELNIPAKKRAIVFALFDENLFSNLKKLYADLNIQLMSLGVLPHLNIKKTQETLAQTTNSTDIWRYDNFEKIRLRLQKNLKLSHNHEFSSRQKVLDALSELQDKDLAEASFDKQLDYLPEQLDLHLMLNQQLNQREENERTLVLGHQEAINASIVSLLFQQVMLDPLLPKEIKQLLLRLRIPLLKLALTDHHFFLHHIHPARLFFNHIGIAVIGWSIDKDYANNSLYHRIETMIAKILMQFDMNVDLFNQLNEDFGHFLVIDKKGLEMAEQRTIQALRGQTKLQHIKNAVSLEIKHRTEGFKDMPDIIQVILFDAWKDVMLLIGLNEGLQSVEWQSAIHTMDRLIWSVNPETSQHQREKLIQDIPDILRQINLHLTRISYNSIKMHGLFKQLQMAHIKTIRGSAPAIIPPPNHTYTTVQVAAKKKVRLTKAELQTNQLTIGVWVNIIKNKSSRKRVKLCWKDGERFLFVNRKGVRELEISRNKLISLVKHHRVEVLERIHQPILDRALENLLQQLNL